MSPSYKIAYNKQLNCMRMWNDLEEMQTRQINRKINVKGAFVWDYSGYSYSGLGITEYTEFQFPKERSFILKTEYSWRRWPENYYVF